MSAAAAQLLRRRWGLGLGAVVAGL
ncbi:MAG: hypothetical protein QOE72_3604, partial [Chloroflexota bacterium]|nr:hypothetical protein [Chloroflexota bacterium]